ncbi:amino acid ABC transporter permease [Streptomyces sp. WMMB 322]|uniref:amino acid ABC transporter permease n=1 Tax=Streptomyces sp. WMMB 322 TaxID=1286821 RepID=UPI0006E4574E|nr:amino acid ABC transporter permease [Streptomyces sp. WMMB 322]SCK08777.1 amino acid ABC transporter membrane protein, PAAT family (TC 3.A.1.3.-) [Streptomyces sp. WMMB 322]
MSTATTPTGTPARDAEAAGELTVVRVRHWGRLLAAVLAVVALAGLLGSLARNENLRWDIVADNLFKDLVFDGLFTTLWLTAGAMLLAVLLGVVLAVMRLSDNPVLTVVSGLFVWFFRGTPLLVQIIFWGFAAALYPMVMIGIPFTDITFFSARTNSVLSPGLAALLALALHEAAYASEIVRAGIQSVDAGQTEAAQSLGMRPGKTMRRIVLPQAMRVIIPPMGNETINMLKMTALVSVINAHDLMSNIQAVYAANYQVIPMLVVASIWYLVMVSVLSVPQAWLERRFGRGTVRSDRAGLLGRLFTGDAAGRPALPGAAATKQAEGTDTGKEVRS